MLFNTVFSAVEGIAYYFERIVIQLGDESSVFVEGFPPELSFFIHD